MKNRNLEHKNDWKTPDSVFDFIYKNLIQIKKEDFFDPCPFMHDVSQWDWLSIDWQRYNFCNPPYSLELKTAFVKKAIQEKKRWNSTVLLLPVSTSTKLFHDYILPNISRPIVFLPWRVKFSWYNTKWVFVSNKCWMHDSMLVFL